MSEPVLDRTAFRAAPYPSLWGNRKFRLLLVSFVISLLGSSFHGIALNLWVLQTTGSAKMMAVVTVTQLLLSSVLGSVGGTCADRWNRRTIMLITDLSSAAVVFLLALLLTVPGIPFAAILLLTGLGTVSSLFQSPAYQSSIVSIVGKEQIPKAAGVLNLAENMCRTAGLAAGGIFVAEFGSADAILFDGVTFIVSFVLVLASGTIPMPDRLQTAPGPERRFIQDLIDGIRYIRQFPFARAVVIMLPALTLLFMPSMMLTQVMAVKDWKATPFQFGLMEACIPLGYMLGSGTILLLGGRIRRRGRLVMAGLLSLGPMYIALCMVKSAAAAIPVILLIGFLFSLCTLLINIILRLEVSEELQGRVFGMLSSIMSVAPSLGLTAASFFSDRYGSAPVMGTIGVLLLLFALTACRCFQVIRSYE